MKTKVIVFDFDGTISRVDKGFNCWNAVWKKLNALEVDKKYYNMYKAKQITYTEWCDAIEKEFIARGIKQEMLNEIGKNIPLMNDAKEFFKILKNNNIKSYILSGGIKNIIEESIKSIREYIEDIQADNLLFDDNGKMTKIELTEGHNVAQKDEYVNILLKKHNILPNELLFIGNGANDEDVYKSGVRTLCFNPDGANYENKRIWNDTIFGDSLMDVLPYINI